MIHRVQEQPVEVREKMRGGAGSVTIRHFFQQADFAAKVRLCAEMTVPPGASVGVHQHNGEDEVYIIVKGSGILDDGKTKERVVAGDAILTGRGESHAIGNDGSEPLVLIAVIMTYPASV